MCTFVCGVVMNSANERSFPQIGQVCKLIVERALELKVDRGNIMKPEETNGNEGILNRDYYTDRD